MKDIQYNIVNTRVRTYEDQLLKATDYERMLLAKDVEEVFAILEDTPYGDFMYEDMKVQDFEDVLIAEQKRMYDTLYAISPDKQVIDLFSLKYDYQNLKVLVKEIYTKEDLSPLLLPFGSVSLPVLKELVAQRYHKDVAPQFNACIQEVFQYMEDYHEHQSLDIIFDNFYWQQMRQLGDTGQRDDLDALVTRSIDVFNISTTLRSHLLGRHKGFISAVLADGGSLSPIELVEAVSQSLDELVEYLKDTPYKRLIESSYEEIQTQKTLNSLDLLKDNFLMARLKERKIVPFGPVAIIGYIYAKETEIKNLRIILVGKINHLSQEIIKSRVREIYV